MKRTPLSLPLTALLLLSLLAGCSNGPDVSAAASIPSPSSPSDSVHTPSGGGVLSSFTSQDLDGNPVDQSIFSGHTLTMVNIWATFCTPCLSEMPSLGEINAQYAGKGVQVVGIVTDVLNRDGSLNADQLSTARELVQLTGADYPHLLPSPQLIASKLQFSTVVPETFFVDASGSQVGESYLGARSKEEWSSIIDSLLEEMS